MVVRRLAKGRALAALLATLLSAPILLGCGSVVADLPSPIGLPEGVPARPAALPPTPAVHDAPPPRELKLLTKDELKKLEGDLNELQEGQSRRAGAGPAPQSGLKPAKAPASKAPAKAKSAVKEKQSSN